MNIFDSTLRVALLVCTITLLNSCYKKYDLDAIKPMQVYDSEWVAPLVNSNITMQDIVEQYQEKIENLEDYNLYLEEGDDNLYTIVYVNSIKSGYINKYYSIPNFNTSDNFNLPNTSLPSGMRTNDTVPDELDGYSTEKFGETITVDLPSFYGADLNYIKIKSGTFKLTVTSNLNQALDLDFNFNSLSKNNETLQIQDSIDPSEGNGFSYTIDLANYDLDLTTSGESNKMDISVGSIMSLIGGSYFPSNGKIAYNVSIKNFEFYRIEGDLGQFEFDTQTGKLPLSLFDNIEYLDNLTFVDPKLHITAKSTVGATASIRINELNLSGLNGVSTNLDLNPNDFIVDAHPDYNNMSETENSSFSITNETSNITDGLSNAPNLITYEIDALFGSETSSAFWLVDTSQIEFELKAELPLDFKVTNILYGDTMANVSLPATPEVTNALKKVQIKMIGTNGFPFEIGLQGYWVNSKYQVIDSLFNDGTEYIIESAEIDNDGYPKNVTEKITYIEMTPERYENIATKATHLIYYTNFHTYDNGTQNVKLLSTNSFDLKMGILIQTDVQTDDYETGF